MKKIVVYIITFAIVGVLVWLLSQTTIGSYIVALGLTAFCLKVVRALLPFAIILAFFLI